MRKPVDYQQLHRGLASSEEDGAGGEEGSMRETAKNPKRALLEKATTTTPKGDNTSQTQMLIQVLGYLAAMDKRMKQMEEHNKQIEERNRQMEEQVAKIPTIEQITVIIQDQVTSIVQDQVTSIVQDHVTSIVQEQVAAVLQTQLANATVSFAGDQSSAQQSYAEVARTPPISLPSNLRSISLNSTPSAVTDTLYCTVDTSRVESGKQSKANPGMVRKAIKIEIRSTEGQEY
jgi:hypothetical protein